MSPRSRVTLHYTVDVVRRMTVRGYGGGRSGCGGDCGNTGGEGGDDDNDNGGDVEGGGGEFG